jgi:hypothetical protein
MAKETQIKLTKTRYRLGCLGVTIKLFSTGLQRSLRSNSCAICRGGGLGVPAGLGKPLALRVRQGKELETGVSNPETFIEEVTEEVRRDWLFSLFRKYGWIAILMVALIVGGTAYGEWQKARALASAEAFGDTLLNALDEDTPDARRAAIASATEAAQGLADRLAIQNLLLASDPAGDRAGSLAALAAIEANGDVSQTYRDLAVLRRVILVGTDMDLAARRAALDAIAIPGRAFRTLAQEQLAYLSVEAGDIDGAISLLRAVSADQEAPTGLRQRASQMIVALGGTVSQG